MRADIFILTMVCGLGAVSAQTGAAPAGGPPQNQNYGTGSQAPVGGYGYQNPGAQPYGTQGGGITFSNRTGQTFSVDQLAGQLRNLQSAVDQALPALTAFNESFVSGSSGGGSSIGGALSNLITGVLKQNGGTQFSPALTNLVAALHGQSNYNPQNPVTVTQNTPRDLATLQQDLSRLPPVFQSLGVTAGGTPAPSQVISSPPGYGTYGRTNQPYPPTGR